MMPSSNGREEMVSAAKLRTINRHLQAELVALQQELFESERYIAWITRNAERGIGSPVSTTHSGNVPGNLAKYVESLEKCLSKKEDERFELEKKLEHAVWRRFIGRIASPFARIRVRFMKRKNRNAK